MKYCLNCRQDKEYLSKANEIFVDYRDRDFINTLVEDYKNVPIILDIPFDVEPDWANIRIYNMISLQNLTLRLHNLKRDYPKVKELDVKFYFAGLISTYYDLNSLVELEPKYVCLEAPLFFDLPTVHNILSQKNIGVRANPIVADQSAWGISHQNKEIGTFVRPEDVEAYEEYIDVFEFRDENDVFLLPKREAAYYRIYAEQRAWPGQLGELILGLATPGLNRLIPPSFGAARIMCGQKCTKGSACRACYRNILMSEKQEEIKKFGQNQLNDQQENSNIITKGE